MEIKATRHAPQRAQSTWPQHLIQSQRLGRDEAPQFLCAEILHPSKTWVLGAAWANPWITWGSPVISRAWTLDKGIKQKQTNIFPTSMQHPDTFKTGKQLSQLPPRFQSSGPTADCKGQCLQGPQQVALDPRSRSLRKAPGPGEEHSHAATISHGSRVQEGGARNAQLQSGVNQRAAFRNHLVGVAMTTFQLPKTTFIHGNPG